MRPQAESLRKKRDSPAFRGGGSVATGPSHRSGFTELDSLNLWTSRVEVVMFFL